MDAETNKSLFRIIVADDDFEDIELIRRAFLDNKLQVHLSHVEDGQYLVDILNAQSKNPKLGNLPHIILLDLNMPGKHGLEVLEEIKTNALLRRIPIIIFTTSKAPEDINRSYELGASCFVAKPQTASAWYKTIERLGHFWIDGVILPSNNR